MKMDRWVEWPSINEFAAEMETSYMLYIPELCNLENAVKNIQE